MKETQIVAGEAWTCFKPGSVEEVTALNAEGNVLIGIFCGGVPEVAFEFGGDALVGIEIEDPGMLEGDAA